MKKKYFYGSLIGLIGIIGLWQLADAQTWTGPKPNCNDPSKTDCNVDGVVWNRSNTSIDSAPIQPGNFKISGRAEIGEDLRVSSTKAIRVDKKGVSSNLNIGNWGNVSGNEEPVNLNIWGNLTMQGNGGGFGDPKVISPKYCFSDAANNPVDCIQSWPAGGGGGGTVTSVGSSNGLTGGPIDGAGSLSIISCGNGKILKTVGGVWACADDATGGAGTLTGVTSGAGISVSGGAPSPTISINNNDALGCANGQVRKWNSGLNTWLCQNDTIGSDAGFYVFKAGDTMSGTLNITPAAGYGLHVNSGGIRVEDGGITNVGFMQNYGQLQVNSAGTAISGYGAGYGAILAGGVNGLYAGSDRDGAGAYIFYQTVPNGAITKSVTLAGRDYALDVWGGDTRFQNNVTVTGGGKITSGTFCIGADCRSSWPTGTLTSITPGTGISVTNPGPTPTVALNTAYTDSQYVKKIGDTMTGGLTLSTGNLALTSAGGVNSNIFIPKTSGIGFSGSRSNLGFLQLWSDDIFYWDLGLADNLTIRNHNLSGNALQIKSGDLVVPNNKWGDGQSTLAGCTFWARNPAGNATQCPVGQFSAGINMNPAGTIVAGIYCCPL